MSSEEQGARARHTLDPLHGLKVLPIPLCFLSFQKHIPSYRAFAVLEKLDDDTQEKKRNLKVLPIMHLQMTLLH